MPPKPNVEECHSRHDKCGKGDIEGESLEDPTLPVQLVEQ